MSLSVCEAQSGREIIPTKGDSHSTAEAAGLWAAAVGLGLLGNDERRFTGVGVWSVHRVIVGVGQGAAVPHRGLSYIQDLITYGLLGVVSGTQ